jgi:hypothetical protein
VVDASTCEHNGLANNVTANECGLQAAEPKIEYWQNQFDQEILAVSHEDDIPAHLLKNVFLKESQFWPGEYTSANEVGLGQFTENGADTVPCCKRSMQAAPPARRALTWRKPTSVSMFSLNP